ncbi:LamG domain-containing protein [Candidatus Sumerlaeota bacterium]|nr:LamG domain-containing protein [Candidatus Sumerlaeota bacterium]
MSRRSDSRYCLLMAVLMLAGRVSAVVELPDTKADPNGNGAARQTSSADDEASSVPLPVAHWEFDEGTGNLTIDSGGNHLVGNMLNMTNDAWVPGKFGDALDFDGIDDRVVVAHDPAIDFSTGSFSVAFWLKQSLPSTEQKYIVKGTYISPEDSGKRYEVYTKEGNFRFSIDDDINKTQLDVPVGDFATGDWVFAVAVRDTAADEIRIYGNAVLKGTLEDITGDISQDEDLHIGARSTMEDSFLDGALDDLRIYDFALGPTQIEALYYETPPSEPTSISRGAWVLY